MLNGKTRKRITMGRNSSVRQARGVAELVHGFGNIVGKLVGYIASRIRCLKLLMS